MVLSLDIYPSQDFLLFPIIGISRLAFSLQIGLLPIISNTEFSLQ